MSHLDAVTADATESPPPCCGATIALVQRLGRDLVCPTCRERYVFDRATVPARDESDGAAPAFRARPSGPPAIGGCRSSTGRWSRARGGSSGCA